MEIAELISALDASLALDAETDMVLVLSSGVLLTLDLPSELDPGKQIESHTYLEQI